MNNSTNLEKRILQGQVVFLAAILSFLLVSMLDRYDIQFENLGNEIDALEDENKERDSKLAELVLNIERRLVTLESQ